MKQATHLGFALLLLAVSGCTTSRRLESLDNKARSYIRAAHILALPELPQEELDLDQYREAESGEFEQPLRIDLRRALALAARHSREYQTSRENLYSTAVTLYTEAHDWDWNVTNSMAGLFSRDLDGHDTSLAGDAAVGFSRQFLSGARLSASLAVDALKYLTGDRSVSIAALANITLTQPLLSGAGPLTAREDLTQAERDLIYALRSYVRGRKSMLIGIADSYYNVLSAMDSLTIAQRNYESLTDARTRSEEMANAGRLDAFEVDQARQDELRAHASLIRKRRELQARKDELKQEVGLPLGMTVELDADDLTRLGRAKLVAPPMTFKNACDTAMTRRLDFATVRDELADAERAMRIAEDALLPKLDLTFSADASSPADARLRALKWSKGTYAAGLDAELPFDKTAETAAYREAMITFAQKKRSVTAKRESLLAEVRSDWRTLKSAEEDYEIQRRSVALAEKRIDSTELLFQAGRVAIREVLDARDSLIEAQNALTQSLVTHRLSWLRLLADLEMLDAEPETLWSPALQLPAADSDADEPAPVQ